jgi:hypothetical protein
LGTLAETLPWRLRADCALVAIPGIRFASWVIQIGRKERTDERSPIMEVAGSSPSLTSSSCAPLLS